MTTHVCPECGLADLASPGSQWPNGWGVRLVLRPADEVRPRREVPRPLCPACLAGPLRVDELA